MHVLAVALLVLSRVEIRHDQKRERKEHSSYILGIGKICRLR